MVRSLFGHADFWLGDYPLHRHITARDPMLMNLAVMEAVVAEEGVGKVGRLIRRLSMQRMGLWLSRTPTVRIKKLSSPRLMDMSHQVGRPMAPRSFLLGAIQISQTACQDEEFIEYPSIGSPVKQWDRRRSLHRSITLLRWVPCLFGLPFQSKKAQE